MHKRAIVKGAVILALLMPGVQDSVAAQTRVPEAIPLDATSAASTPRVTVRLHAGPNPNLMRDWRDGLGRLWDMTEARGLSPRDKSCICMSWGSTALVHVTSRVAIGGAFEMLRDTRRFTVTDELRAFGPPRSADFAFHNEAVVQTTQAVVALYPHEDSRAHVQVGGGLGTGHTNMSTPGSDASGHVRGTMLSVSGGTESRFLYVDAGWRLLRMRTTSVTLNDAAIDEARDVFGSVAELQDFVRGRDTDLTGGWARVGLVFHFGRRITNH
jgi:hypothetical protein